MQTQGITVKNSFCPGKPKTKDLKSVFLRDNTAEPAKKENKQNRFKCQQERTRELKETPATGINTIDTAKKKKKRDTSKVTNFNYDKKSHYASNCTKPKN